MARGGARPGAGRKAGGVNKNSQAVAIAAAAEGKLAHEILLDIARGGLVREPLMVAGAAVTEEVEVPDPKTGEVTVVNRVKYIERPPTVEEIIRAAGLAAPFYAPKLQAVAAVKQDAPNAIEELMKQVTQAATNRARPGQ